MSYSLRNKKYQHEGTIHVDTDSDSSSDDEFLELATNTLQETRCHTKNCQGKPLVSTNDSIFVIDKTPNHNAGGKTTEQSSSESDSEMSEDDQGEILHQMKTSKIDRSGDKNLLVTTLDTGLNENDVYISNCKNMQRLNNMQETKNKTMITELMKKSVISSDLEKKHAIPPYQESLNQLKKKRRQERDSTKGKSWFGMKAAEMTEEKKNDLQILHMRRVLDPKRFYKGPDMKGLPKFFEMGRVVETSAEFYSSRIPKKQRKRTLADELLADAEFRKFNKRKYSEIQESKRSGKGVYKHMKRLKKKKK